MTDGLLWFTDLSSPDPTGILPILGGTVSLLNMLTTSTLNTNSVMRKLRRYMFLFPLITVPIWMTFPAVSRQFAFSNSFFMLQAFNLYWVATNLAQLIIMNLFRMERFRKFMGIPEFLPGSKLERMNTKLQIKEAAVSQVKTFSHNPTLRKKAK